MSSTSLYTNIAPTAQDTTASYVLVANSILNTLRYTSIAFTILNTGANSIHWKVVAGNTADLSDGIIVQAEASVASGAGSSYSATIAPFSFYGVYVKDVSGGSHGTALVTGVTKR